MKSLSFLASATDSYAACIDSSGEVIDPVLGEPTQYGTAYHAFSQAVLALKSSGPDRSSRLASAALSFRAAVAHVADTAAPANASSLSGPAGAIGTMNHRDFFWPPIWKTLRILRDLGWEHTAEYLQILSRIDPAKTFRSQPPGNWAAVWLSGEYLRLREGLSPFSPAEFDDQLEIFFQSHILLDQGFYMEPGHSNSYDLFTRYHFADLLVEGYDGRLRDRLEILLRTGLRRSLGVQLSDGSLASAHRSTGQTWTVGCQCAFFTLAARHLEKTDPALAREASRSAALAFSSLQRWQRPHDVFSPVENLLPPNFRVGYEPYTADAHYGNLPLGFLASAILHGFTGEHPASSQLSSSVHVDNAPIWRGVVRAGPYAAHLNGFPHPGYDALGLADITFGPGRIFHFVSPVTHVASRVRLTPGIATRDSARSELVYEKPGHPKLTIPVIPSTAPIGDLLVTGPSSLRLEVQTPGYFFRQVYELSADAASGVTLRQSFPYRVGPLSVLIPYLRDPGSGVLTSVKIEKLPASCSLRFHHADEEIEVRVDAAVDSILHLAHGYESRRGLCGLIRLDLTDPSDSATLHFRIVR